MTQAETVVSHYHLFERIGVELEYMVVDRQKLNIRPIVDQLIHHVAGAYTSDVDRGDLAWSNELALHVLELKTNGPALQLTGLAERFQHEIHQVNQLLANFDARLMPTAMHPWMDPYQEMQLWPHEYNAVYEAFNRIFDCRGHGWANLQSMHLNLPFANDEEFGRLHAAIRLILPLLPGVAASSPLVSGRPTGMIDNRMDVYRRNSIRVREVAGDIIPEPAFTESDYREKIFEPMYAAIRAWDIDGVLQDEFLNARGAIARFGRGTIEIRVIDIQECPQADLGIAALTWATLQALCSEHWSTWSQQRSVPTDSLVKMLDHSIRDADRAVILDRDYLQHFGCTLIAPTVGDLWSHIVQCLPPNNITTDPALRSSIDHILQQGPLSRRILSAIRERSRSTFEIYQELCDCLEEGRLFGTGSAK